MINENRVKVSIGKLRLVYGLGFCLLLVTEVLIALFVRDRFIRPYGGDILVTMLICCFVRIFFPVGMRFLPLGVFVFAAAVEVGQYFDFVSLIGLEEIEFFKILLGTSFSWIDLICYGIGCLLFFVIDYALQRFLR